jgi:hypothetical protein
LKRERWLFLFAAIGAVCALAAFCKIDVFTISNLFGAGTYSNAPFSFRDGFIIVSILGSFFLSGLGVYLSKGQKGQEAQRLVLQDIYYLPEPTAPGYPHKLKIVVSNGSASGITLKPATWKTSPGDLATPPLTERPWQREGPRGWQRRDWEQMEISEPFYLPSGRAVQTWVGLLAPLDEIKLRRRIVGKRLGTLIVPFIIDGRATSETIRL